MPEKPVLYLYPEEEMEVTVTLDFDGTLTSRLSPHAAMVDSDGPAGGTLTNPATGRVLPVLGGIPRGGV